MTTALATQNGATVKTVMGSLAERYSMDAGKLLQTIKATCIKGQATNEQVQAFLLVANRYGLDPFTKEIHAFAGQGGIVPMVGIDGWCRLANNQKDFDGCDFAFEGEGDNLSCTCTVYVKGRAHPVRVTEYMKECKRNTQPWNQYPRRMLRHKAFMQCVRVSFGLGGIYDEDEARDIAGNNAPLQSERPSVEAALNEPVAEPEASDFEGEVIPPAEEAVEPNEVGEALQTVDPDTAPLAWIDDEIRSHKPANLTAGQARKAFHAADVQGWDTLTPERRRQKYAELKAGKIKGFETKGA